MGPQKLGEGEAGHPAWCPPLCFVGVNELRRFYQINNMKAMSFYFRTAVDDVTGVSGHSGSVSSRSRCAFLNLNQKDGNRAG